MDGLDLLSTAYESDEDDNDGDEELSKTQKVPTNNGMNLNEKIDENLDTSSSIGDLGTGSACGNKRLKLNSGKALLPLPDEVRSMYKDVDVLDDNPDLHEGRERSFPHKRGNWTSFVYIPFKCLNTGGLEYLCNHISSQKNQNRFEVIHRIVEPHLSLTKTVVLRHHWIDPFISSLQSRLISFNTDVDLVLDTLELYVNDEKTRTFLGMKVLPTESLLGLVRSCDLTLSEFNLESYYKDPSFHISLAWTIGDQSTSDVFQDYAKSINYYWDKLCGEDSSLRTLNVDTLELKTGHNIYKFELPEMEYA